MGGRTIEVSITMLVVIVAGRHWKGGRVQIYQRSSNRAEAGGGAQNHGTRLPSPSSPFWLCTRPLAAENQSPCRVPAPI